MLKALACSLKIATEVLIKTCPPKVFLDVSVLHVFWPCHWYSDCTVARILIIEGDSDGVDGRRSLVFTVHTNTHIRRRSIDLQTHARTQVLKRVTFAL